jgi:quinohemoprotein ethanol dehydrogenase
MIARSFAQRAAPALIVISALLAACSQEPTTTTAEAAAVAPASSPLDDAAVRARTLAVTGARIADARNDPDNWLAHGRDYAEQRFSPLAKITATNVGELGLAWYWDTGSRRGLQSTPIVVDGVMFNTGSWSTVFAHDARSGELLWSFDPEVPRQWGRYACCDVVNRGVALWRGKVFVGTLDGRLIALDAGNGRVLWEQLTIDRDQPYTITGAPRVLNDMVVIGNGGAEYGVRGYVTAYDTESGEQRWRFYTVPGNPAEPFEGPHLERAAETWSGDVWWQVGGGGTVWDSMAFDPQLNLLYLGVGNGSPWNHHVRSNGVGDNLYLSSIVAVDPDDGSMVWYYQTTPGDTWDYTATQHMILADIEINGETRKVIMQAPKNGFFYLLDRVTGEFISAEPYVEVTWASHVDPETGRPIEDPAARYVEGPRLVRPSPYGGHNWHPMTYSPHTGLVYIPALDIPFLYGREETFALQRDTWNVGIDTALTVPPRSPEEMIGLMQEVKGHLSAWDPVRQKEAWRVQHTTSWNGGLLSTAGNLVFQGRSDGYFAAYAADSGTLLWEYLVHTGIVAAPVTFAVDGEQYVAVAAGWGGAFAMASGMPRHRNNVMDEGRILVFKLRGDTALPTPNVTYMNIPEPPAVEATDDDVAHGEMLYHRYCSVCHGAGVVAAGQVPDLRYLDAQRHGAWEAIVRQGALETVGMPGFAEILDGAQARAIQAYIVAQAHGSIMLCESEYRRQYPELLDTACVRRVSEPAPRR